MRYLDTLIKGIKTETVKIENSFGTSSKETGKDDLAFLILFPANLRVIPGPDRIDGKVKRGVACFEIHLGKILRVEADSYRLADNPT